ncbi:class I SAM-dependent methyltransferase [Demetria terragena]|uniref:class I SAM-dependent methyltransferase n=1 Tax=Demetria terragena TaxID=63959 RepID=UPI0003717D59|nr:class I SAM-dependent methyltransferase [Demetria terragena]
MGDSTQELREAHDVLAEVYATGLSTLLDEMPVDRAVLGLFAEYVRGAGLRDHVGDIGCGTGRLAPFLAAQGFSPCGVDLSPEMIRVARRDFPAFAFDVADLRSLPFEDSALAGAVAWYSLMYLAPEVRSEAYAQLARVIRPGGYVVTAFKVGDGARRRGGTTLGLGIGFDIYWFAPEQIEQFLIDAGFRVVFTAQRPAEPDEPQPQGYVIAQKV